ncbi:MAG: GNAT family N-acetyltransferase [Chloroflexi bacterium]|nr:GNAT family N-acetyltransferase [Chloroflexota bacterium]
MFTIGLAKPSDGPSVLQITANTRVFNQSEQECVDELWNEYRDKKEASDYTFLICSENDRILGYACYGAHSLTQGAFDLYWIAVDPEAQGKGVGQALLGQVEQFVRNLNGRLLIVETSGTRDYRPARRFYRHNGYKRVGRIPDFYSPGDDLYIYSKHL